MPPKNFGPDARNCALGSQTVYQISNQSVVHWRNEGGYKVPTGIDTTCPMCRRAVTFTGINWDHTTVRGMPILMRCPRCAETTALIRLGDERSPRLYADAEQPGRSPVPGLDLVPDDVMPQRLRRSYHSALNVLAAGEAPATAVTCRRVLEGVTANILPDEQAKKGTLYQRISALSTQYDLLSKPLIELSDLLRQSGNRGAHFVEEDDLEPTLEDAELMVDLLDYLFTYLYVVPQQIHNFRAKVLERTGDADSNSSGDAA